MKFYNSIQKALLFVCSFAVLACSQQEEYTMPNTPNGVGSLDISVIDAGIYSNDPQSRAVTDGEYKTTFVEGDQIGLFAVNGGNVLEAVKNVCLTYDGTKWTVAGGTTLPYTAEQAGADYYVYYPYTESLTSSFDASQADDPFATIVSNWTIGDDLEEDNYTKNDLMTSGKANATGSGQKFSLSFTLTHRMALVLVELPAVTYSFTNGGSNYTIPASGVSFSIGGTAVKPFYDATSANYRLLVKPEAAMTIEGKFTNGQDKKYNIALAAGDLGQGKYAYYRIDGGNSSSTPISHTLQIGDYYCADGSIVSKDANPAPSNAIGIVYQVGTTDAIKADFPSCDHALVYALKRVEGEAVKWGSAQPTTASWYDAYGLTLYNVSGIQGYEDTKVWMGIEDGEVDGRNINDIMKSLLESYRQANELPGVTTGWYVPSYKELDALENNATVINASLDAVSGERLWADAVASSVNADNKFYWSSTIRNNTAVVQYDPSNKTYGGYISGRNGYYRFSFGF